MLIFVVFLVSVNMLIVKTENVVVRVTIKQGTMGLCIVQKEVALTVGAKVTLEVVSDFFIKESESHWTINTNRLNLKDLENTDISVIFNKTKHTAPSKPTITIVYKFLHTRKVNETLEGIWSFVFRYFSDSDPLSFDVPHLKYCSCDTSVRVLDNHTGRVNKNEANGNSGEVSGGEGIGDEPQLWVYITLPLIGLVMLVQSSYIIYGKVRSRRANRNNDKEPRRNIADRPPLPLPPDEVIQTPPKPPISPRPVHKHHFPTAPPMPVENPYNSHSGPLVPNHSYRNKALVTSVEELRTPGFPRSHMNGPIVPKQSYTNSISDDSDEEHKSPGFARKQIEAKFAQVSPKGIAPSKSFKFPKPLPRFPPSSPTPQRVPAFNPAHRPEPVPPLHPKKLPVFPSPADFRKQEPSRMSDDEWQYEQLQPASKYLNNFSTTNNYNYM